ncbi:MAG: hypothetical protein O3A00_25200, partial [Planctomycetota bacterium]|nr:hypothetical protein [Planctomycetota bacterium]
MTELNPPVPGDARLRLATLIVLIVGMGGCGEATIDFTEVKRIDENLSDAEVQSFVRIIDSLPDNKLPEMPEAFVEPPEWNPNRTLPVGELVDDELLNMSNRWSEDAVVKQLKLSRRLERALNRERMTPKQFVGLATVIGTALSRSMLDDKHNFDQTIEKGEPILAQLRRDDRPFSSLSPEGQYQMLQRAVWLTRVDRAKHLKLVPRENIELVRRYRERLSEIFPESYVKNPLNDIADLLEEKGLPFVELDESGSDEHIEWEPTAVITGTDTPDGPSSSSPKLFDPTALRTKLRYD